MPITATSLVTTPAPAAAPLRRRARFDGAATYRDSRRRPLRDQSGPCEAPLTLLLNDRPMATLLATPESLEPLALGHAYTAGWITRADQVTEVRLARLRHGLAVHLSVAPRIEAQALALRRAAPSLSSCGACGLAEEGQLLAGLRRLPARPPLAAAALRRGLEALNTHSAPGLHLALGLDAGGRPLTLGRDIGRHNALDRVIGEGLRRGRDPGRHFAALLVSSRCSLELVHKAVRAGITTLATLALPSDMAVEVARACDLNLICCHRGRDLELLSGQAPDTPENLL
ncbi:formate dehydrogenase accessory sulfurtransferase FdhD [Halomonas sp. 328]|uniref:formate dehydrogenase accessory sulfurtransferase FdhD n=1 Tax=Halomonas sp. 328 TaxID=2776704 RepID=UPI0018A72140|nr:formate dehydrogenase accessory sulfurtransferase FdhD [Halomonas sp. 328]MBF8223346.1 formate dehydrogenase accessory sulfurtransferase FdhD [Halomonas sp. 328]